MRLDYAHRSLAGLCPIPPTGWHRVCTIRYGDRMSFELHQRKHIEHELAKIVRRELRHTARALTTSAGSKFDSAVHESRKSVKKVRAVAAVLKQAGAKLPRKDRKRLKSAARALSRRRESR